jgi:SP family sugar:H+ symporter-like MFS transporter
MGFLSLKKPDDEVGAAWPSIMVGAFAAFAGILYGYDTGTASRRRYVLPRQTLT